MKMTDTDTFCFPSSRVPTTTTTTHSKLKLDTRYFQNAKVIQQPTQQPSSSSIWNMIHTRGFTTTTTSSLGQQNNNMSKQKHPSTTMQNNNKDLVAMMDEQLKRLTSDLVQKQQEKQFQKQEHQQQLSFANPIQQQQHQMESLWDYLDTLERVDLDMDEHLPAHVYFTGREMEEQTEKSSPSSPPQKKTENGFLPSAFNSICNLVGNVFKLPSLIMGTWHEPNPNINTGNNHNSSKTNRSSHHPVREQHLFFDVDDIDFLPETQTESKGISGSSDDYDDQYEAFFLDVHDTDDVVDHSGNHLKVDKQNGYETTKSLSADHCGRNINTTNPTLVSSDPVATAGETITTTASTLSGPVALDNTTITIGCTAERQQSQSPIVPDEKLKTNSQNENATVTAIKSNKTHHHEPTLTSIIKNPSTTIKSSAVDIVPPCTPPPPCTRRFISTPDQECSRMAVIGAARRKRQTAALLARSTPIPVKSNVNCSYYRQQQQPRTLYQSKRTTLNKNRKEKRRHEIEVNIHEDCGLSSDSEGDSNGCVTLGRTDVEDDDLLPLTARNLTEPSCLVEFFGTTAESSMNSSAGSAKNWSHLMGSSVPRRNSINFQSSAVYEKEFPVIGGQVDPQQVSVDQSERDLNLNLVTKKNGVYFEIPNSPQRRMLMPVAMTRPLKMRTNSVMSSSVGSSPATSFDGKFWGRRVRTVSEGSEDDLIEFVCEEGTDYLADVFSSEDEDGDSDEDYSSEEETSEEEEETETESESEVGGGGALMDDDERRQSGVRAKSGMTRNCAGFDLLDSGVEEKKVRFGTTEVRVLRTWDYAHRQARTGNWMEVGRDRGRFRDRTLRVGTQLKPVLSAQHRERVFNERFADFVPIR